MKKAEKDKAKEGKDSKDELANDGPLKINFGRFVAKERKNAIVAFAEKKLSSDDSNVIKVYRALVKFDSLDSDFYHQLSAMRQLKT